MNVSCAIIGTEHKTLAEIATHLYDKLRVPREERLCGDNYKVNISRSRKLVVGFLSAVGKDLHQRMTVANPPTERHPVGHRLICMDVPRTRNIQ